MIELLKRAWYEYKAKKEMGRAAAMLEALADTLPTSTLREMYPNVDPIETRNNMLQLARLTRRMR